MMSGFFFYVFLASFNGRGRICLDVIMSQLTRGTTMTRFINDHLILSGLLILSPLIILGLAKIWYWAKGMMDPHRLTADEVLGILTSTHKPHVSETELASLLRLRGIHLGSRQPEAFMRKMTRQGFVTDFIEMAPNYPVCYEVTEKGRAHYLKLCAKVVNRGRRVFHGM
jgi:hypothetical protein